jgi:pectinesterase
MRYIRLFLILFSWTFLIIQPANSRDNTSQHNFIVSQDGSGDYSTIQEAINAVPDFRKKETVIYIKNGVYKEKLILATSKSMVVFIGESVEKTIITYNDYASRKNRFGEEIGTTGSSGFFIFGDDFRAENITFENSAGAVGQAVAVRTDGDRLIFRNCRFLGFQDTLYPHGEKSRQYYQNCYIEGTVDFIFGSSTVVFKDCEIYCKGRGYITAASTPETSAYGFVFMNCKITGNAPANSFYLGRPWRPFASVIFLKCELGEQIRPEGWNNWNNAENEKTARYAEYKNYGPGADISQRVKWSRQLNDGEGREFTLENIFSGWNPDFTE